MCFVMVIIITVGYKQLHYQKFGFYIRMALPFWPLSQIKIFGVTILRIQQKSKFWKVWQRTFKKYIVKIIGKLKIKSVVLFQNVILIGYILHNVFKYYTMRKRYQLWFTSFRFIQLSFPRADFCFRCSLGTYCSMIIEIKI